MSGAEPTVPCDTCGEPTMMTGTRRCDACWEVERRLADYLRRGGEKAKYFVIATTLPGGPRVNEEAIAGELWRRLITLWESAEEDELHEKLGALVDEWQGFVGKRPVIAHFLHEGRAVCGSPGPYDDGGAVNCDACKLEVRSAVDLRNAAREQAQAKEKKGT